MANTMLLLRKTEIQIMPGHWCNARHILDVNQMVRSQILEWALGWAQSWVISATAFLISILAQDLDEADLVIFELDCILNPLLLYMIIVLSQLGRANNSQELLIEIQSLCIWQQIQFYHLMSLFIKQNSSLEADRSHSLENNLEKITIDKKQDSQRLKISVRRKCSQYQNKASFFQGQLNPLALENKRLKEQIVSLNKSMLISTDILRNLLPIENNPDRKLKIQMAPIEDVCAMIKQDWHIMEGNIEKQQKIIQQQAFTIQRLNQKYQTTVSQYQAQIQHIKTNYNTQIAQLRRNITQLHQIIQENQRKTLIEKQKIIKQYQKKMKEAEKLQKDFKIYQSEMRKKCEGYQRAVQKLKDEIASNLQQFQKSKASLKQIYDQIMSQKLQQQKQTYEFMLDLKEKEKAQLHQRIEEQTIEFKKKLSQKNSQISYLSGINDKLKQEVGACKDEIWAQKLKIDENNLNIKSLQAILQKERECVKGILVKLGEKQQELKQKQKQYEYTLGKMTEQVAHMKEKIEEKQRQYEEQKKLLNKKLQQNLKKLSDLTRRLRENDQKFQQYKRQQKERIDEIKKEFKENEKFLNSLIEKTKNQLQQRKEEIHSLMKKYLSEMEDIEEKNKKKLQKIQSMHAEKLKNLITQNQQSLRKINLEHERIMKEKQIANNQYVRKMMEEHNKKIHEQNEELRKIRQQSEEQRKNLQEERANNLKLAEQIRGFTQQIEKQREESARKLQQQKDKFENEKKGLMDQMLDQINEFKKALSEKQAEYERKFAEMQQEMIKQINLLKQNNAMEAMEEKYNQIINKLKLQMDEARVRFQKEKKQALQAAEEKNRQNIESLTQEFNKQLSILSEKLQFNISKLNQELLNEKEAHEFSKMSREEKIAYLVNKIQNHKNQLFEKETKIIELEYLIDKKDRQLGRIQQIVAERLKQKMKIVEKQILEIRQQCIREKEKKDIECRAKIKEVEYERIKFTQDLYEQFQIIKQKNDREMSKLKKKYDELEMLFQERPSRAEDLFKIKELINEKAKMDQQIREFKKKVREANQIVKYLNLELENYKQTYDIFGPGGECISSDKKESRESPLKSAILSSRRQITPMLSSQDGECSNSKQYFGERRISTEGDVNEFKVFPVIRRSSSRPVFEQEEEQQDEQINHTQEMFPKLDRNSRSLKKIEEEYNEDKSKQLKSNADIFLSLLSNDHRPAVQVRKNLEGYGKKVSIRRKISQNKADKRFMIKDRTMTLHQ